MRIVVCLKQIRFTYARTGRNPEEFFLSPEDSIFRINPYDEIALEMALCLKEAWGRGEIILVTLGPIIAENELRRCLAMGADEIYQIDEKEEIDTWRKSVLLARAIKELEADVVLCGKESLDTQNGQVGAFIAHSLDLPFVSAVMDLAVKGDQDVEARRSAGRGIREIIECRLPAVFSVEMGVHEPRLPTYEDKKKSQSTQIRCLSYPEEDCQAKTFSAGIIQPRPRPKEVPAPDSGLDSFERIQQLLAGSRIDKKGEILMGDPESQAENIISFLKRNNIV